MTGANPASSPMTRQEMLAWLALLEVCLDLRNPTPELKAAIAAVQRGGLPRPKPKRET